MTIVYTKFSTIDNSCYYLHLFKILLSFSHILIVCLFLKFNLISNLHRLLHLTGAPKEWVQIATPANFS